MSKDLNELVAGLRGHGGAWLATARNWMQWHRRNGDTMKWGSQEEMRPPMTAKDMEDFAGDVAEAAFKQGYRAALEKAETAVAKELRFGVPEVDRCVAVIRELKGL